MSAIKLHDAQDDQAAGSKAHTTDCSLSCAPLTALLEKMCLPSGKLSCFPAQLAKRRLVNENTMTSRLHLPHLQQPITMAGTQQQGERLWAQHSQIPSRHL